MKAIRPTIAAGRWLTAGGVLLAGLLVSASTARAVIFTANLPMPAFTTGTTMQAEANPTLGTFDFTAFAYGGYNSLDSISITLALYDLQTMATGTGQDKLDFGNITLSLGGADTAVFMDNYLRLAGNTNTISGAPANGAAILQALATNGGMLSFGLIDSKPNPANAFDYFGGTASLSLDMSVVPVPFHPTQALGLGLAAVYLALRRWPRVKRRLGRP